MARARGIKPSFFKNEDLVELSMATRLLFIGLWTLADRAGRLEDRPKRIHMEIFPGDSVDVDDMLTDLAATGMVLRYSIEGKRYLEVVNFQKHQHPHRDEKASTLPDQLGRIGGVATPAPAGDASFTGQNEPGLPPQTENTVQAPCKHDANTVQAPCKHDANTVQAPCKHDANTVLARLTPDSLTPDSPTPDCTTHTHRSPPLARSVVESNEFDEVSRVCVFLQGKGVQGFAGADVKLVGLVDKGACLPVWEAAVAVAEAKGRVTWPFVLGVVRRKLEDAARVVAGLPKSVPLAAGGVAAAVTVPGRVGVDPALARIEADRANTKPPSPEMRARLAALSGRGAA